MLVSGEALVSERQGDAARQRGFGDTTVVLKRAFAVDSATAFGLEFEAKVPTARTTIGSGKADYGVNGIFSRDMGSVHMDLNLNATRLGDVGEGEGRMQSGASAAFSVPLNARWGATGELAATRRSGVDSTAQLLVAATYSPGKQLVFDAGVARGLNHASPEWAFFTGLVMPLARLW